MRIVFMGTPDFAVASLKILVEKGWDVVGVVTAPDRPSGRGLKLTESAVKKYAVANELKVLQPEKLRDEGFLNSLKALEANLFVVVAFRMLPEVVWAMPSKGTFNLHGSLLPKYRGAAPINWAVINGETETGATTFFLEKDIDTGGIIDQVNMPIGANDTAGDVHDALMEKGAVLVAETVAAIEAGTVLTRMQEWTEDLPKAPKIFRENCKIDWEAPLKAVHNKIRGLSPYPGAWTALNDKTVKVLEASCREGVHGEASGSIKIENDEFLVAVKGGYIIVSKLQIEGKKRMLASEFIKGFQVDGLLFV